MANFRESFAKFIFWAQLCGLCLNPSNAQEAEVDPLESTGSPPVLSAFAVKMRGVCSKPKFLEQYISNCSKSSTSVLPPDQTSYSSKFSVSAIIKVRKQNDLIMAELINRAIYNNKVPTHQPQFGFDLLSTALAIYAKVCPVVPPSFLQTVYHLFSYIHWKTAHNRKAYLPKREQKWISKLINNCTLNMKVAPLLTDVCKETVMTVRNCTSFICTKAENEFRLMRTDPIADTIFKTMEMVQAICFPYFSESYRMFHFFNLAIMDTFTDDIKIRWVTQLEDFNFWKRLLGPNFETHLINLERCNEGIISDVKFHYRIPRNSLPARIRLAGAIRKL